LHDHKLYITNMVGSLVFMAFPCYY